MRSSRTYKYNEMSALFVNCRERRILVILTVLVNLIWQSLMTCVDA